MKMLLKKTKARKWNSVFGYDGRPSLRDSKYSCIRSASGRKLIHKRKPSLQANYWIPLWRKRHQGMQIKVIGFVFSCARTICNKHCAAEQESKAKKYAEQDFTQGLIKICSNKSDNIQKCTTWTQRALYFKYLSPHSPKISST